MTSGTRRIRISPWLLLLDFAGAGLFAVGVVEMAVPGSLHALGIPLPLPPVVLLPLGVAMAIPLLRDLVVQAKSPADQTTEDNDNNPVQRQR